MPTFQAAMCSIFLFGGLAGCMPRLAKPTSEGLTVSAYMPLAVGNQWTFVTDFQGQDQADITTKIVKRQGSYFIDDRKNPTHYRLDEVGLRDGVRRYLLKAPIELGTKWMSVADVRTVEHYEIVRINQRIDVPAGVFHNCVTVRMLVNIDDKTAMTNEMTFAPGVGIVRVSTALKKGAQFLPQSRFELKSYQLNSPSPEALQPTG